MGLAATKFFPTALHYKAKRGLVDGHIGGKLGLSDSMWAAFYLRTLTSGRPSGSAPQNSWNVQVLKSRTGGNCDENTDNSFTLFMHTLSVYRINADVSHIVVATNRRFYREACQIRNCLGASARSAALFDRRLTRKSHARIFAERGGESSAEFAHIQAWERASGGC